MAEEGLKLKEMTMQMKSFETENRSKHEPLEMRFKSSIDVLANQKQKLMHQLQQVMKFLCFRVHILILLKENGECG